MRLVLQIVFLDTLFSLVITRLEVGDCENYCSKRCSCWALNEAERWAKCYLCHVWWRRHAQGTVMWLGTCSIRDKNALIQIINVCTRAFLWWWFHLAWSLPGTRAFLHFRAWGFLYYHEQTSSAIVNLIMRFKQRFKQLKCLWWVLITKTILLYSEEKLEGENDVLELSTRSTKHMSMIDTRISWSRKTQW